VDKIPYQNLWGNLVFVEEVGNTWSDKWEELERLVKLGSKKEYLLHYP
jgi:hypothetical protein